MGSGALDLPNGDGKRKLSEQQIPHPSLKSQDPRFQIQDKVAAVAGRSHSAPLALLLDECVCDSPRQG